MKQNNPNMSTTAHPSLFSDGPNSFWRGDFYGSTRNSNTSVSDTVTVTVPPDIIEKAVSQPEVKQKEYTGGSVSYYRVSISHPTSTGVPYIAECNDIIEALGMNYAEGNAFKAIWRSCAARNLGISKDGYKDGLYDAEKVVFFGKRMVEQAKNV